MVHLIKALGPPNQSSWSTQAPFFCRDYALLFGSVGLTTTFIPSFRNMRIFSFIAILGTTFTSWYLVAEAGEVGLQPHLWSQAPTQGLRAFVEGGTALLFVYGGHAMLMLVLHSCFPVFPCNPPSAALVLAPASPAPVLIWASAEGKLGQCMSIS